MTTWTTTPAPTTLHAAWTKASDQLHDQFWSGIDRIRRIRQDTVAALVTVLWFVGIVGDGLTTVLILKFGDGRIVEGNPAAAALMGAVGIEGWGVVAAVVCLPLVALSLGTTPGLFARSARVAAFLIGAGKVWFAVTNYVLWTQVSG